MEDRIKFLLDLNNKKSKQYISSEAVLARKLYRAQHPTAVCALKCMDGRLNFSVMTKIQPGIVTPWRNLGGRFDLGWPYFSHLMLDWVDRNVGEGRNCLILITYHFSKGDIHRGCRGFNYDVEASKEYIFNLKDQFDNVFGKEHTAVL